MLDIVLLLTYHAAWLHRLQHLEEGTPRRGKEGWKDALEDCLGDDVYWWAGGAPGTAAPSDGIGEGRTELLCGGPRLRWQHGQCRESLLCWGRGMHFQHGQCRE